MKISGFIAMLALVLSLTAVGVQAEELVVEMHYVTTGGIGEKIGTVTISDNPYGTLFTPMLSGLSPGLRGFHVHEFGDCGPAEKDGKMVPGEAAGGHFDPADTGRHEGPYGDGHLGDLPALYVNQEGRAEHPVLAPRIKVADIKGRALMIHAGGDNYSDQPRELGGGGSRIACGVID
jgi:superoxide dismutase, Cu-Zn family